MKADARFAITDFEALKASLKPRRTISAADVPAIRAALLKDFNCIREPASWSVADAFQAAARLLRGEASYAPGKVYGFLERPVGVFAANDAMPGPSARTSCVSLSRVGRKSGSSQ